MSSENRLTYFAEKIEGPFTRKDYMTVFNDISSATASRDLRLGVELTIFGKEGDKTKTIYKLRE